MLKKRTCLQRSGILILILFLICLGGAWTGMALTHELVIPVDLTQLSSAEELRVDNGEVLDYSLEGNELVIRPTGIGRAYFGAGDYGIIAAVDCRANGFAYDEISGRYTGAVWTHVLTLVFVIGSFLILLLELNKQIALQFYHYATPLMTALTLLFLMLSLTLVIGGGNPGDGSLERLVTELPMMLVLSVEPVLALFTLAMLISNLSLLRHEGKTWRNLLGSILGLAMIAGTYLILANSNASGSQAEVTFHSFVINIFSGMALWTECKLLGVILCGVGAAKHQPARDKDYVLILGCMLSKKGGLTPLLRGRVDRALRFAREQQAATGKMPVLIPCGGKGTDELRSEAEAMKEYLLEQGVPEDGILTEDRSANTWENIRNARAMMSPGAKVAYSTTNYHVFRAGVWASRNDVQAEGMGSKTKWYYWPNAFIREYVALVKANLLHELLMIVLIGIQSGILTYLMQG